MAEAAQIKGTERAAILLMTLGEQTAAAVLRHMEIEEVQKLGTAMAGLADVPRERVTDVLGQLLVAVQGKTPIGIGTGDYLRKVMTDSLGERPDLQRPRFDGNRRAEVDGAARGRRDRQGRAPANRGDDPRAPAEPASGRCAQGARRARTG
jgi:hypothetical protein